MGFARRRSVSKGRFIASVVVAVLIALSAGYCFGVRNMRFFLVPSESMYPILQRNDYIVTLNQKEYRRGDIVVLVDPKAPRDYLVKRIVGVPGDTLATVGGALFIDGRYASEPYVNEETLTDLISFVVPAGEVFVLGDNRNASEDSLTWGRGAPLKGIVGRVRFIYSPVSRMGLIHSYPLGPTGGPPPGPLS